MNKQVYTDKQNCFCVLCFSEREQKLSTNTYMTSLFNNAKLPDTQASTDKRK